MGKHAEWRKAVKKLRRKRIRISLAVIRDQHLKKEQEAREGSATYRAWLEQQRELEEFRAAEERRLAMQQQAKWEADEEAAMMRWRDQQSRLAQAKAEKVKREIMIREEWEREQRKLEVAEEARKKVEDEKQRKQAELLFQIDAFIEGKGDFPDEANVSSQTHPGHPECPFFSKTGACRFRDSCSRTILEVAAQTPKMFIPTSRVGDKGFSEHKSFYFYVCYVTNGIVLRNHTKPGISRTLLIPNFYDHIGLTSLNQQEYDTDQGLEYEDHETYHHFKEFFKDVLPEFEQCGRVSQFRVCTNEEPHLRGNVYVEFGSRRHALKAYRTFQGRFYAGRQLNVEFTTIPSWKNAVCGLYHKQKCPKGKTCNFLHVFKNPDNAFKIINSSSRKANSRSQSRSPHQRRSKSKEWNWSEDSDRSDSESSKKRRRRRSRNRNKIVSRKYDSGSEDEGKSQSSRNPDGSRERKKRREKRKSRSRSPSRSNRKYKDNGHDESSSRRGRKDREDDRKRERRSVDKEESSKQRDKEDRKYSSKYDKDRRNDDRKTDRPKLKSNKESRQDKY